MHLIQFEKEPEAEAVAETEHTRGIEVKCVVEAEVR